MLHNVNNGMNVRNKLLSYIGTDTVSKHMPTVLAYGTTVVNSTKRMLFWFKVIPGIYKTSAPHLYNRPATTSWKGTVHYIPLIDAGSLMMTVIN